MFSLSIALDGPIVWALMFKTKESADTAWGSLKKLSVDQIELQDDFGQRVLLTSYVGAVLEDMSQTMLAHGERYLHDARTRTKAQQAAQADPMLRAAQMTGGPAVLSPMMNGPFPRN